MPSIVQLSSAGGQRRVTFTLDDAMAARPAADFVFDVVGTEDFAQLVESGVLADADLADLRALQKLIFDHDDEGPFIRDGVTFRVGGRDLDPDAPLADVLTRVAQQGARYARCDMEVRAPFDAGKPAQPAHSRDLEVREDQMREWMLMQFVHQLAIGYPLDVTKDHFDIEAVIAAAENRTPPWIEIDVSKALYVLSAAGKTYYQHLIDEAQELVKRYDIYGDVEVDASGKARFDTGLGDDLRVPIFELKGVSPFRARILLGLNDGDWDDLADWRDRMQDPAWYEQIFAPLASAPTVDHIGRERLEQIMDQARAALRDDDALRRQSPRSI